MNKYPRVEKKSKQLGKIKLKPITGIASRNGVTSRYLSSDSKSLGLQISGQLISISKNRPTVAKSGSHWPSKTPPSSSSSPSVCQTRDIWSLDSRSQKAILETYLNDYFTEPGLIDIVCGYCAKLPFISTWNVGHTYFEDIINQVTVTRNDIVLPLSPDGKYDFTVDWGDGTSNHITSFDQAEVKHVYPEKKGTYVVQLDGLVDGFTFSAPNLPSCLNEQIIDISQWGCVILEKHNGRQFNGCLNLKASASDVPDLTGMTNMTLMFGYACAFNGDVSRWDTSSVTSMYRMFRNAYEFNGDVSQWNTSNVVDMSRMFLHASKFDRYDDLLNWDVSKMKGFSKQYMSQMLMHTPASYNMT